MKRLCHLLLLILLTACGGLSDKAGPCDTVADTVAVPPAPQPIRYTDTEQKLLSIGLVDVQVLDSSIQVHLVYATPDNFLGRVLYPDVRRAFLLPSMAQKVVAAQQALHLERPDLNLLVLDAARPMSVQYQMFHLVAGTHNNIYVANPKKGPGMHNYGAAVDITLVDTSGRLLPMGSDFDYFGVESHIDRESHLLAIGSITQEELDNRRLLRRVMRQQGLQTLSSEWWHFNLMSRQQARSTLTPIPF